MYESTTYTVSERSQSNTLLEMLLKPVFEGLQVVFDMRVLGKGKEKYLLLRDVEQEKKIEQRLGKKRTLQTLLTEFFKRNKKKTVNENIKSEINLTLLIIFSLILP